MASNTDSRNSVTIYLGKPLREQLNAEAELQDRPMSRIVKRAIALYLDTCRLAREEEA